MPFHRDPAGKGSGRPWAEPAVTALPPPLLRRVLLGTSPGEGGFPLPGFPPHALNHRATLRVELWFPPPKEGESG